MDNHRHHEWRTKWLTVLGTSNSARSSIHGRLWLVWDLRTQRSCGVGAAEKERPNALKHGWPVDECSELSLCSSYPLKERPLHCSLIVYDVTLQGKEGVINKGEAAHGANGDRLNGESSLLLQIPIALCGKRRVVGDASGLDSFSACVVGYDSRQRQVGRRWRDVHVFQYNFFFHDDFFHIRSVFHGPRNSPASAY